jgi:hypothetical protein
MSCSHHGGLIYIVEKTTVQTTSKLAERGRKSLRNKLHPIPKESIIYSTSVN